ncbi:MoaD/ThiS family protein [Deferribacter autotrophicus]|uniref:MoaD/ThiS family protein n=1 Tax=Deferribacter autotrophicus TaxID=500465 RepID=A0A5A8F304_9BACT|nr:MoaD/ThiS family protein [Deferribacter autotrophicus]KAA0257869.1 MoaD/ThiS family protein [Deferribacter autotrophicus]
MIIVEFANGKIEMCECKTVKQLFKYYNLKENSVIVVRGEELLTEDDRLKDGDKVKIIPVVSGG